MLKWNMMLAGVCVAMVVAGGCAMQCPVERVANSPPEQEDGYVPVADPAMQLRTWERATAYYGNGNAVAGPTGFVYQPARGLPDAQYVVLETPLFIGQAVAAPLVLLFTPPWTAVTYTGSTIDPTYTAMPPVNRPAMSTEPAMEASMTPAPAAQE